jgi:DNA polymerase-1
MLNVQSALVTGGYKSRLLLQVHDELILEVVTSEVEKVSDLVRVQMGSAYPLKAPLDVSVGIGKSWNDAAH